MQPLTTKETEYIVDSLSNEDLAIKQCIALATHTQNPAIQRICLDLAGRHQQHYQMLLDSLQQHIPLAPQYPQQ
ncbi:hypothetical protein [Ammoniphilus sp. CFH 90114]|uniref:hypothetical protein n=1 Tax=Ammoniphilus sp. CFH 90114 TaxID=2493665 RepID=UPI00100F1C58|nr:hypothetical protein [Ammoniphilus sp. CFH 90114]RXT06976.1 hypothetical protein EIZ39_12505 [Ammoniphilus sp. CFH 90114]